MSGVNRLPHRHCLIAATLILVCCPVGSAFGDEAVETATTGSGFFDHDIANKGLLDGVQVNTPHRSNQASVLGTSTTSSSYYRRRSRRPADSFAVDANVLNESSPRRRQDASEVTPSFEVAETPQPERPVPVVPASSAAPVTGIPRPADKQMVAETLAKQVTDTTDEAAQASSSAQPGSPEYIKGLVDQVKGQTPPDGGTGRPQPKNAVTDANRF